MKENTLGKRIKKLRVARNFTRSQLSAELKMNYTTLANYENDIRQPDYATLIAISKYFHVDPNTLLGFTQDTDAALDDAILRLFVKEAKRLSQQDLLFFTQFLQYANNNKRQ